MAGNTVRQNRLQQIARDPKAFQGNVGQGFQQERARRLTPDFASFPDRETHGRALSTYRGNDNTPEGREARVSNRQAEFLQFAIPYDATPFLYLPAGPRIYFLLQNLDAALDMYVGFGVVPSATAPTGLRIAAGQAYEPYMIPQNDVWIVGTGVGDATLIYAVR
jgi:hypothetical protein